MAAPALKLKKLPGNSKCADCGKANPGWASLNIGVLMCLDCSGCHRNLGTHISKVRSLTMDKWTSQMVSTFKKQGGNTRVNSIYEANLGAELFMKAKENSDRATRHEFIREKYDAKRWHASKPKSKGTEKKNKKKKSPRNRTNSRVKLMVESLESAGDSRENKKTCPRCTFANHSAMPECEMCGNNLVSEEMASEAKGGLTAARLDAVPDDEGEEDETSKTPTKKKKKPKRKSKIRGRAEPSGLLAEQDGNHSSGGGDMDDDELLMEGEDGFGDKSPRNLDMPDEDDDEKEGVADAFVPMRPGPPIRHSSRPAQKAALKPLSQKKAYSHTKSRADLFKAANERMTEPQRVELMKLVKEGRVSVQDAVKAVMNRPDPNRSPPRPPRRPMIQRAKQAPQESPKHEREVKKPHSPTMSMHFAGFDQAFNSSPTTSLAKIDAVERKKHGLQQGQRQAAADPFKNKGGPPSNQSRAIPQQPAGRNFKHKSITFVPGPMGLMTAGQKITRVVPGGQAAERGVKVGWMLVGVEKMAVTNNEQVVKALKKILAQRRPFELTFATGPDNSPEEVHSSDVDEDEDDEKTDGSISAGAQPPSFPHQPLNGGQVTPQPQAPGNFVPVNISPQQQPFHKQRHPHPPPTQQQQQQQRMAPRSSPQTLGPDAWRKKYETVTTQTVQAVMVLRKDSIAMNERVSRLEAKSMSQPHATNDPRVQEMVMELKHQNQTMAEQILMLQAENLKLTNAMKRIISTLREMKMQSQPQSSSQVGSPPTAASVPAPELQTSNPFLPQSANAYSAPETERKEANPPVNLFAALESPNLDTPQVDAPQAEPPNIFQGLAEETSAGYTDAASPSGAPAASINIFEQLQHSDGNMGAMG
mmetsp:Transcript_22696/g.44218  ORF Transcript_22696/g.44218 Transcript_22696/m.44218 type:complete len:871 (-) Transcript_22696:385-2997(-)